MCRRQCLRGDPWEDILGLTLLEAYFEDLDSFPILGFPGSSDGKKNVLAVQKSRVQSLGAEGPLEKGNGNPVQHSCLENFMDRGAWRIQSTGSHRVGHNRAINNFAFPHFNGFLLHSSR